MADNTLQYEWIVTIKGGLDAIFVDDPNVFVAGDLLWYPVEGKPTIRIAPDVDGRDRPPQGIPGLLQAVGGRESWLPRSFLRSFHPATAPRK